MQASIKHEERLWRGPIIKTLKFKYYEKRYQTKRWD